MPRRATDVQRTKITQKCRCDGVKPVCGQCLRSSLECAYATVQRKRGPRPGTARRTNPKPPAADGAGDSLGDVLARHLSGSGHGVAASRAASPEQASSSSSNSAAAAAAAAASLSVENEAAAAIAAISLAENPEGARFNQQSGNPRDAPLPLFNSDETIRVGDSEVRPRMIDVFFKFVHPFFPVISMELLAQNIQKAHPLLLNAIYATAMPYVDEDLLDSAKSNRPLHALGDPFFFEARRQIDEHIDQPDLYAVAGTLLLAVHSCLSGRGSSTWHMLGIAMRMAFQISLHVDPSKLSYIIDPRECEERRALWWICYEMDRYSSNLSGLPPYIKDHEHSVRLPEYTTLNDGQCTNPAISRGPDRGVLNAHSYLVQLLQINTDVQVLVRSYFEANQDLICSPPDTQLQSKLERRLTDWYTALPSWMISYMQPTHCGKTPHSPAFFRAYVHIIYHLNVITVRLPAILHFMAIDHSPWRVAEDLQVASSSASAITQCLREVAKSNPACLFMSPFMAYCLSMAGMIHALTRQYHLLEIHIVALAAIGRFVFLGSHDANFLNSLKYAVPNVCVQVMRTRLKSSWALDPRGTISRIPVASIMPNIDIEQLLRPPPVSGYGATTSTSAADAAAAAMAAAIDAQASNTDPTMAAIAASAMAALAASNSTSSAAAEAAWAALTLPMTTSSLAPPLSSGMHNHGTTPVIAPLGNTVQQQLGAVGNVPMGNFS
nr:hypothetical protein HK105_000066 [Polyrhizophydium stewartii]